MFWLLAILQFSFTAALEVLSVLDLRFYRQHKTKHAVLLSGVIGLVAGVAILFYVDDKWLLFPDILGLMFGTYIVMKYFPWED